MKRTLSDDQLPTLSPLFESEVPEALSPGTSAEQTQSKPVLSNRTVTNSSTELVDEVNQLSIPTYEHSAPEKSDRSTTASQVATSAITDDGLAALNEAAWSGDVESQFELGERYDKGVGVEVNKKKPFYGFKKRLRMVM